MNELQNTLQIIADNIKRKRAILQINQDELAYRAGMHRAYVGCVERAEKNITIGSIQKFAKALNCSLLELLTPQEK